MNEIPLIFLKKTVPLPIDNKIGLNQNEILALELNLGYLVLNIINTSPTIDSDKVLNNFIDDVIVKILKPDITTNYYYY